MRRRVSTWAAGLLLCLTLSGCTAVKFSTQPGTLQITSSSSAVRAGDEVKFSALPAGGDLVWRVNGIPGGNATLGTIDASGSYRAPAKVPATNVVAISAAQANASAESQITILSPVPRIQSASASVSGEQMSIVVHGSGFLSTTTGSIAGVPAQTNLVSSTQINLTAAARPDGDYEIKIANPDPGAAGSDPYTVNVRRAVRPARGGSNIAAARFLDQATFGGTAADVAALQPQFDQLGATAAINNWVDQQAALQPSAWPQFTTFPAQIGNANNTLCGDLRFCLQFVWVQNALSGQDQLRQRMAFSLSQIWVTSGVTIPVADSMTTWYQTLNNDAFGNYRTLMKHVTLTSAMGYYLDMGNSAKPANGSIANENYARELMQLFSMGLYKLNDDGTYQLDINGQPQPAYSETDIQNLARVLTGWTYKRPSGTQGWNQSFNSADRTSPMVAFPAQHDTGSKVLLEGQPTGTTVQPNASPTQQSMDLELDQALDSIFNSANVPPFVSKNLIQHFVTSNPSPAYVSRVSQVFKDNGSGVRGDLKAVIKAILTDPEARAGDTQVRYDDSGHLREPVLYMIGMIRALGVTSPTNPIQYSDGTTNITNFGASIPGNGTLLNQNILFSPTVFNYFPPDYALSGTSLLAPEFQIHTSATAPIRANFADQVIRNAFVNSSAIDISPALNAYAANANSAPDVMVEQMNQRFMYGQMSIAMKQAIMGAVTALPSSTTNDATFRAKLALYLILSSSQYQVVH